MEVNRFTEMAQAAIQSSQLLAGEYGHQQIESEHLLLALVRQQGGVAPPSENPDGGLVLKEVVSGETFYARKIEGASEPLKKWDLCIVSLRKHDEEEIIDYALYIPRPVYTAIVRDFEQVVEELRREDPSGKPEDALKKWMPFVLDRIIIRMRLMDKSHIPDLKNMLNN